MLRMFHRASFPLLLATLASCREASDLDARPTYVRPASSYGDSQTSAPRYDAIKRVRIEGDQVFFMVGSTAYRSSLEGPAATTVLQAPNGGSSVAVSAIASDRDYVFVAVGHDLWQREVNDPDAWTLLHRAEAYAYLDALDVDERYLYFTEKDGSSGKHRLMRQERVPRATALEPPWKIADFGADAPSAMTHDETFVYFASERGVFRTPIAGPYPDLVGNPLPPEQLSKLIARPRLAVVGPQLYLINDTQLVAIPREGGDAVSVLPKDEDDLHVNDFAVDEGALFVSARSRVGDSSRVLRITASGPTVLVEREGEVFGDLALSPARFVYTSKWPAAGGVTLRAGFR